MKQAEQPSVDAYVQFARSALLEKVSRSSLGAGALSETKPALHDQSDDYRARVVFRAHVEPTVLDQMRVELWVTDNAEVAVGLETWERAAALLGLHNTSHPSRFVTGHEPLRVTFDYIRDLVEVVAGGGAELQARALFGRLNRVHLALTAELSEAMRHLRPAFWPTGGWGLPLGGRMSVRYRPW